MVQLFCPDLSAAGIAERELARTRFAVPAGVPGVFLATCNRTEFYHGEGEVPHAVARHLFRVTSGLESHLPGEHAIQQQVKEAYALAGNRQVLSSSLHKLFQHALRVGKQVRTQTGIARGAGSHSQLAFELIREAVCSISKARVTLIGVNNLNECIIRYLRKAGLPAFYVGNRTLSQAQQLAAEYGGQAFGFDQLGCVLEQTDVLVTATSAPHFVVKPDTFPKGKAMCIIDLAFPRDVDPHIGFFPGVQLHHLDSVEQLARRNIELRYGELARASAMVDDAADEFVYLHHQWLWKRCA